MQIREVNIRPAVCIHVADGRASTIVRHGIGQIEIAGQLIGESHSRRLRLHQGEARFPADRWLHPSAAKACAVEPRQVSLGVTAKGQENHRKGVGANGPDHQPSKTDTSFLSIVDRRFAVSAFTTHLMATFSGMDSFRPMKNKRGVKVP